MDNPLLGPDGAAAVFGPQKGATPADVATLDAALAHFVAGARRGNRAAGAQGRQRAGRRSGRRRRIRRHRGTGAQHAGPGIDVVLEFTGLAERLAGADLVITGEGSLDEQSLLGKTPWVLPALRHGPACRWSPCAAGPRLTPEQQQNPVSGRSTL